MNSKSKWNFKIELHSLMVSFYYDNESNISLIWDVHLFLNYFVLIKLPYERIITTNNTTEFISNLYDGSYCV